MDASAAAQLNRQRFARSRDRHSQLAQPEARLKLPI